MNEESSENPGPKSQVESRVEKMDSLAESNHSQNQLAVPEMDSTLVALTDTNTLPQAGLNIFELVDQFQEAVYRYSFRLSGNQSDAEDITQQTFMIAQQKLDQLRDHAKACGWLMTIARSCFLKSIRRQRPTSESVMKMSVDELPRTSAVDPIDRLALQDALQELSDDYRVVVVMFYFDNFSYKEIAAELDVKIGTVMSRLSRAKSIMRQILVPVN